MTNDRRGCRRMRDAASGSRSLALGMLSIVSLVGACCLCAEAWGRSGSGGTLPIDCTDGVGGGAVTGAASAGSGQPCSADGTNSPGCYKNREDEELVRLLEGTPLLPFDPPVLCGDVVDSPERVRHVLRGSGDASSPSNRLKRDALTTILNMRRSALFGDGLLGTSGAACFGVQPFRIILRCGELFLPNDDTPDPEDALVVTEETSLEELVRLAGELAEAASCPELNDMPCGQTLGRLAEILNKVNASKVREGECGLCKGDITPPVLDCPTGMLTFECQGDGGAAILYDVSATDDCDPNPHVVCFPPPGTVIPVGTTRTVQCVASDLRGNASCSTFEVEVLDTTPPEISCPAAPIVVDCVAEAQAGAVVDFQQPVATDICGGAVDVVCEPAAGGFFPFGTTEVTASATDANGNTATCTFTIEVVEETLPTLFCPEDITVECAGSGGTVVEYPPPMLSESCQPPPDPGCNPPSGSFFPVGETVVTCSTVDQYGNPVECQFTVTVVDTQAPVIVCPQDISVECTSPNGTAVTFEVSATDRCDDAPAVACDPPSGTLFPLGPSIVTCVATDAAGNQSECAFTVTVRDTTPPDITCPAGPITASCNVTEPQQGGAEVNYPAPMVTDTCDSGATVVCDPPSGTVFPLGSTTVTCTATDGSGNSSECSFEVVVVDDTPPELVCVEDVVVECTSREGAVVEYPPPVVVNECNGTPTVTSTPPSGSLFPVGTTTVSCTATDQSGNVAECSFGVTVDDTTPPEITCPADVVVECESPAGTAVEFSVTASDVCDPAPTVTSNPPSGSTFPLGVTIVTSTATDMFGNQSACQFNVSVVDTTPPEITCPASFSAECDSPDGAPVMFTASAEDICDTSVEVTCVPPSGSVFPQGTTTVTCVATDSSGNVAECSFEVSVADTTPPQITCSENAVVIECDQPGSATVRYPAPVVSDSCDGAPIVECDPPAGAVLPLGVHTAACVATDSSGNSSICMFEIQVVDTVPPDLVCIQDIEREGAGPDGAVVAYNPPVANDTCDTTPNLSCLPASGSTFPLGETLVTCTADDQSGNMIQCTFVVRVLDTTPPQIECPGDISTVCTAPEGALVSYGVSAADVCDPEPAVVCDPPSGSRFPLGETVVTCTATDRSGNVSECTFVVTVVDDTPPTIVCPEDFERECEQNGGSVVEYPAPSVFDSCDPSPSVVCDPPSGTFLPLGANVIACTAVDSSGNEASCEFTVTVVDTTAPKLVCPPNKTVQCEGPAGTAVSFPIPVSNDACDGQPPVTCVPEPGSNFSLGDTEVVCSSTDRSGNMTQCSFIVSVVDTLPPDLSCPEPISVECASSEGTAVEFEASSSDACTGEVEITYDPPSGSVFPIGETAVTCRSEDSNGNANVCTFTVTVVDTTPPDLDSVADITGLVCTSAGEPAERPVGWPPGYTRDPIPCTYILTYDLPVATDGCQDPSIPIQIDSTPPSGTRLALGMHTITYRARDVYGNESTSTSTVEIIAGDRAFIRGDANADAVVDIADAVWTVGYLFVGTEPPPCLDSSDTNDDGYVDLADVIYGLSYNFRGGPEPPDPYLPICGLDPTVEDPWDCERYPPCE